MTFKAVDLAGLQYFKSKLNLMTSSDVQTLINTTLADYITRVNLFTGVSTLPATGTEVEVI
ncbi:MAG: hypothetical protein IJ523_02555 [Succinivibrionaceae bacterium]|nr:hypothetical protein [Succinivibrionaceae bacterium]